MIRELAKDTSKAKERCLEAYEQAKQTQDKLNAVITFVDPSEQLENCPSEGKFAGVPIALKDNVNMKGVRTTAGSQILSNYLPIYNAEIVDRLEKEGAIVIAKASMDELAMGGTNLTSFTGPAHNPWNTERMTGGSSGGSAALVASGVVPMAIGSDTGDSVRKPASFCGVVGVKPTYGRISRYGIIPYASSLDHVGYFTRSIEDACTTLSVLAGRDDRDMTSSFEPVKDYEGLLTGDVKGKKIAVFGNVVEAIQNENTKQMFQKILDALKEKGASIDTYTFDDALMKALFPTYYIIANCEATANHSNLDAIRFGVREDGDSMEDIMTNSRTKGFGPLIRKRFVIGSYGLFEENQEKLFKKAQRVRRLVVNAVNECFKEYDALIAPASGDIAPLLSDNSRDELSDDYLIAENHMVIGNFGGYPSITVPMGFEDGCPIGVNVTCAPFMEDVMFDIGKAIEDHTGYKDLKVEVK